MLNFTRSASFQTSSSSISCAIGVVDCTLRQAINCTTKDTATMTKICLKHTHIKRKDSLETRAELAILRTYVENQAILEPTNLYPASKCKQSIEKGSESCFWTHIFTFLCDYYHFFSFFCNDANTVGSNCYNRLQFVKETQISSVSNTEPTVKLCGP